MSVKLNIEVEKFKGILLDLDNTLYEYNPCHEYALECCYKAIKEMNFDMSFEEFILAYKNSQRAIKQLLANQGAGHSRLLYFQRFFENIFKRTDINLSMQLEELYWNSFFSKMVLRSGMLEFLKECRQKGIKICIISDLTAKLQFRKIINLRIENFIDFIVSSEEAGQDKPGSQIYKLALEKIGLLPGQVMMIGDSYEKDVVGAKKLGIKTFLLKVINN